MNKIEHSFASHLEKFIDFVFFIYSVSPRVNSTIKVSHILSKIIKFLKEKDKSTNTFIFNQNNRERVFKKILDESSFILKKNGVNEYTQVESLYLLTVLRDLGKDFRLSEKLLLRFINSKDDKIPDNTLNYFSIVVILFYIGHSKKYNKVKTTLINYTFNYISVCPKEKRGKSSEITHLILDLFTCPYIKTQVKRKMYAIYKGSTDFSGNKSIFQEADEIIVFHKKYIKYWFTKWERFNLAKELENKKSQEVYS